MRSQQSAPLSHFAKTHTPIAKPGGIGCFLVFSSIMLLLALGAFLAFFFALPFGPPIVSTSPRVSIGLLAIGIAPLLLAPLRSYGRKSRLRAAWAARNNLDYAVGQQIQAHLAPALSVPPSITNPSAFRVTFYPRPGARLSVGEMIPYFDQQTQASFADWLDLTFAETAWNTPPDDGFVAVFHEQMPGGMVVDTVRVIVPSEPTIRAFMKQFATIVGKRVIEESHCHDALSAIQSLPLAMSHVADRLAALLRTRGERMPTINIVGAMLDEGLMLGEAIRFGDELRWYNLFPISICMQAEELAGKAEDSLQDAPLPPYKRIRSATS